MAGVSTAVLGAGLGAYKAITGAKERRDAERTLNNYERTELTNAYENMPISTMGADLLREENARTSANLVDALRMGGTRSILGGIPKVVSATNEINRAGAKMLDDQVINRNYNIAGDDIRIQGMKEARDNQNIAALSSRANAGRQDMWDGIMGIASGVAAGVNAPTGPNPTVEAVQSIRPIGLQPMQAQPITATPYGFSPYSVPSATPYDGSIFGDMFSYDDMINKYR